MKREIPILVCISLMLACLFACKESAEKTEISKSENSSLIDNPYPPLPMEIMGKLFQECNYVDYIFNNLPFSVSQDSNEAIKTNLSFFEQRAPEKINKSCKSLGREFFQISGEIIIEAEIYYSNECQHYIFYKDGKPMYSNVISASGKNFYQQLINNAQKLKRNNSGN